MRLHGWHLAALGAIAFLVIVPLVHITGPNYHHPVPRVVHHVRHVRYVPNPYQQLTQYGYPTTKPQTKSGRHTAGAFLIGRLLHHTVPYRFRFHPWRRVGIRNPIPWRLR